MVKSAPFSACCILALDGQADPSAQHTRTGADNCPRISPAWPGAYARRCLAAPARSCKEPVDQRRPEGSAMSRQEDSGKKNGLTYAEAGVDIDAGNAMVEKIKPLVRSTRRPGADGEIGGFGGLFDLKAAGFTDPVLVAANDGVGTKLKIAIESGKHDTVGIDLVAMCVNDLVVQGRRAAVLPRLFRDGKARPRAGRGDRRRHRRGLPAGRLRADRRRDRGDARHVPRRRLRPRRLRGRRRRARPVAADRRRRRRRRAARACLLGPAFQRLLAGPAHRGAVGPRLVRRRAVRRRPHAGRRAARADAHLCEIDPQGDPRHARRQGAGAHHRRRLSRQHSARAAQGLFAPSSISARSTCRRCSPGWPRRAACAPRR